MVSMPTEPDGTATPASVSRRVADEARADELRARLIAADGFDDTLSALRADRAIAVMVQWLRDEAARRRRLSDHAESSTFRTILLVQAETIDKLAKAAGGESS